jgi:tetratricopeptide (TPR) repeat protein
MSHAVEFIHIDQVIEQAWVCVRDARVQEARTMSEQLVQSIQLRLEDKHDEKELLCRLAGACHVAGYSVAMSIRSHEALVAVSYFREMERVACVLRDDTQLVIALTYQGDMYRRLGDLGRAKDKLLTAYGLSQPDRAAQGNCAQLLGRVYSQLDDPKHFLRVMKEAREIAMYDDSLHNSLHGQYCLGTVYVDYARYYSKIGNFQKAFYYYTQAEATLPDSVHWRTFLTAIHGLLLVKSGNIENGMPYVVKAVELAHEHGNHRLLDNFYALQGYLSRKAIEFNKASVRLGNSLYRSPTC